MLSQDPLGVRPKHAFWPSDPGQNLPPRKSWSLDQHKHEETESGHHHCGTSRPLSVRPLLDLELSEQKTAMMYALSLGNKESGKSKWGLSNGGLKPLFGNLRTIVYNCALLWRFWTPFLRGTFVAK